MNRDLFSSCMVMVSRNSIKPSGHVSLAVNFMVWSMELMYCRKIFLCSTCCRTKISSTYLFYNLGAFCTVLSALGQSLPCIKWQFLDFLRTHGHFCTFLWNCPGNKKYVLCRQNPSSFMMLCTDIIVLCWSSWSWPNLYFIILWLDSLRLR